MTNKTDVTDIYQFYENHASLRIYSFEVCMTPLADTYIDGWIGVALRNRLLFAAERELIEPSVSLREKIKELAIIELHPLYKEMAGGFPSGFGITLLSHGEPVSQIRLLKGEPFRFSIQLYGKMGCHYESFVKAVKWIAHRGLAPSSARFNLLSVTEPVLYSISDYIYHKLPEEDKEITIRYEIPVNLYNTHTGNGKSRPVDSHHEFPGFYQLVSSAAHRMIKLSSLYIHPKDIEIYQQSLSLLNPFLKYASRLTLAHADIKWIRLISTAKKDKEERIQLDGYVGQVSFSGNCNYYIPLLLFARHIGVGSNISYGLGKYEVLNF